MAQQSLYALLGVTDKATPEDIRRAFDACSAALAAEPESEDKRNQVTFLHHARETLLDPRARALHDRAASNAQTPDDVAVALAPTTGPSSGRKVMFAGIMGAVLVVVALLGKDRTTQPPELVLTKTSQTKSNVQATLPKLNEVTAQLAEPGRDVAGDERNAATAETPGPRVSGEPMPIDLRVARSPLFDKIIDATYAIVGTQTMGTGVAIEKDRLLTNCHVLAPNVLKGKIYAISARTQARHEITQAAFLVKDDACVALVPGLVGQPLVIGETKQLRPGATFHNLGFADGTMTLSEGKYLGSIVRSQQDYLVSTNYCVPGVSGGALVGDDGKLLGITSGSTPDHRFCASLTAETARSVLAQSMIPIDAFPTNYLTNFRRRW